MVDQIVPVSVVMITQNAERTLTAVLESVVGWVDEVVVVDSGSTDATMSIAAQFGCRTQYRKFDGFGSQKQFAVDQARNDWVFVLDADEVVSEDLKKEIQEAFRDRLPEYAGYFVSRSLIFLNKILRYSGQHCRPVLRLFNRKQGSVTPSIVHEKVEVQGRIGRLDAALLHYSYHSLSDYLAKMNKYTTLSAHEMATSRRPPSLSALLVRFPASFLSIYLIKGGILDGYRGLIWSLLSAMHSIIKYAKLYELTRANIKQVEPSQTPAPPSVKRVKQLT